MNQSFSFFLHFKKFDNFLGVRSVGALEVNAINHFKCGHCQDSPETCGHSCQIVTCFSCWALCVWCLPIHLSSLCVCVFVRAFVFVFIYQIIRNVLRFWVEARSWSITININISWFQCNVPTKVNIVQSHRTISAGLSIIRYAKMLCFVWCANSPCFRTVSL